MKKKILIFSERQIKSHKKAGLHPPSEKSEKDIFGKTTVGGGSNWPHSLFRVKEFFGDISNLKSKERKSLSYQIYMSSSTEWRMHVKWKNAVYWFQSSFKFHILPLPHLQCLYRNSHGRCSVKKAFSKISQNSQENVSIGVNTGFSLRISWNF